MKSFYVYIMASQRNGTLYVGSTSDLISRVWEHKNSVVRSFTSKYKVHMLVYYEIHEIYVEAARREKRFKHWSRQWKLNLIEGRLSKLRFLFKTRQISFLNRSLHASK